MRNTLGLSYGSNSEFSSTKTDRNAGKTFNLAKRIKKGELTGKTTIFYPDDVLPFDAEFGEY